MLINKSPVGADRARLNLLLWSEENYCRRVISGYSINSSLEKSCK